MEQGLTLPAPAGYVAGLAMALDLADVTPDGRPSLDLPRVFVG